MMESFQKREKFLPYSLVSFGSEEIDEVVDTLKSGWITTGPKVIEFEKKFAEYIGCKHAISVNSCTSALHLSLVVNDIGFGDEVITTPFTFASTGNVIVHQGATPVFVDVEKDTFNIDPNEIEKKINSKTKAIIVVHYAGYPCKLKEIHAIANKHDLVVIEDAAHAIGTKYEGKMIGNSSNLACFSFYATKNMTTSEGGMITTNDDELVEKLRILRLHGISKDAWKRYEKEGKWYYNIVSAGYKYNMTDIQAALGIHQLRKINNFNEKRRDYAEIYMNNLNGLDVVLPNEEHRGMRIFHLFPILLNSYDRNQFIEDMKEHNIGTSVHFIPLHLHPFYQEKYGYKRGVFPIAESIFDRIVSLPLYPRMSEDDIYYVINVIKKILNKSRV